MTIGIPRALFYWKQPHFWEVFFETLGYQIVLSPETNKEIVGEGVKVADPETCFSIKVLYGHLLFLDNKTDLIFLPRMKKNELGEYCPKFFALPDLAFLFLKTKILSLCLDESRENLRTTLTNLGREFGKRKDDILLAMKKSLLKIKEKEKGLEKEYQRKISSSNKKIVLISHPYNLYDEYINLGIKSKLEKLGVEVIFIDEVPFLGGIKNSEAFPPAEIFHWEFAKEMLSETRKIAKEKISGAIEISAFQCGCDAVIKEFIEKEFTQRKIPFLYLLIDEHSAEAGLQTRLEAFVDTLKN